MKVVITGASGQLGRALSDVLAPGCSLTPLAKADLDVTCTERVVEWIERIKPDIIVHAGAYTDVDGAERNPDIALRVNSFGTGNVAAAAQRVRAKLVCVSTDYVFDGSKGTAYSENDAPSPINAYGMSKLLGEQLAAQLCDRLFIVRTAWLFGPGERNFVKSMYALMMRQPDVKAAVDAIGSPTYTLDLARFIAQLMQTDGYGTYHAANAGSCSRYEFAQAIMEAAGLIGRVHLTPARTEDFALPAKRPLNSALVSLRGGRDGIGALRDWKSALEDYLRQDRLFATVNGGGGERPA